MLEQTLDILDAIDKRALAFFFRTSDGYELDLVLDWGANRWAIEVKLMSNPMPGMIDRLRKTADLMGADRQILTCHVARKIERSF